MSQAIVGTWYAATPGGGTDHIAFSFLADGTFLVADKGTHANDPNGDSGLEYGTYTWNESTGALTLAFSINTDGQWGLSHSGITSATVVGDVLALTGAEGTFEVPRMTSPDANTVVGSWYMHNPQGDHGTEQAVFTFLADGTYLYADKGTAGTGEMPGTSGIEWGTYTWNPTTGAFTYNTLVNTDGEWGLSHTGGVDPNELHVSGDTLMVGSLADHVTAVRLSPVVAGITGTPGADTLTGTAGGETIAALAGNDTITGMGGNDTIDGGDGIDFAGYSGTRSGHTVSKAGAGFTVSDGSGADGLDTLTAVERLHFTDTNVALDVDGNAGNVARILGAVFGSGAILNREFVGIGLDFMDGGMSYEALMQLALNYTLGGTSNHTAVVNLLWGNVMGGSPPANDLATYVGMLDGGMTAGALGVMAAGTSFNESNINLTGLAQTGIEYT